MKIVHIMTRLILGGAQENTLITCKLLAERGHDVTLITGPALGPEGQMFRETEGQKYKTIVVDKMRRAIKPVYDIVSYAQIKKILAEIQPDIVHTHSSKAGILGRIAAKTGHLFRVPFLRRPDRLGVSLHATQQGPQMAGKTL